MHTYAFYNDLICSKRCISEKAASICMRVYFVGKLIKRPNWSPVYFAQRRNKHPASVSRCDSCASCLYYSVIIITLLIECFFEKRVNFFTAQYIIYNWTHNFCTYNFRTSHCTLKNPGIEWILNEYQPRLLENCRRKRTHTSSFRFIDASNNSFSLSDLEK